MGAIMSDDSPKRDVLAIDVGGSHVKAVVSGEGNEPRRFDSGSALTPQELVSGITGLTGDWSYDAVSIGIPAVVRDSHVVSEPVNLGEGWVGFDFEAAFGKPTKVVNDAAMQALGSYEGGKMLFLGFGTGLGSALVVDGLVEPMEIGHLGFRKKTFEDYVGERALRKGGKKRWQKAVREAIAQLSAALEPDYIVLGGGNAALIDPLPPNCRLGDNHNAFAGGFRLWQDSGIDGGSQRA
jgi:predicted NBD/HSP70 family sugar kinase